ncbi:MAG: acylphosphatase, partial [Acidimicrobiia bacterium]
MRETQRSLPLAELHAVVATVSGRVHGVGFRYSAQRIAKNLELVGWVMNRSDGTVQTWAQGSRDAVDRFLGFLEEG